MIVDLFDVGKTTSRPGTSGEGGTGYGMPLIKKFMDTYQGTIEIQSEEKTERSTSYETEIILNLRA